MPEHNIYAESLVFELNAIFAEAQHQVAIAGNGTKYTKIVIRSTQFDAEGQYGSVHAFVGRDGQLYKPATYKAPELKSGARWDISDADKLAELISLVRPEDWSGGYLYSGVLAARKAAQDAAALEEQLTPAAAAPEPVYATPTGPGSQLGLFDA